MPKVSRNQSHELGVKVLYAMLINIKNNQPIDFNELVGTISGLPSDDIPVALKTTLFNALKHYEVIIEYLSRYLKDWKFSRLNIVTQAILIYSYTLFTYTGDVNKAVVINVAVKLAKDYLPAEEYKFINGILDEALINAWSLND